MIKKVIIQKKKINFKPAAEGFNEKTKKQWKRYDFGLLVKVIGSDKDAKWMNGSYFNSVSEIEEMAAWEEGSEQSLFFYQEFYKKDGEDKSIWKVRLLKNEERIEKKLDDIIDMIRKISN